ncbi:uncharacterized protein [Vulpes vulpes]|uniref:Uncharacterized protein isoform X3 n=1 Tax=Vulpes vulpes TaxID=9627 RepID=A0ABM4YEF8_VULVU
MDPAGRQPAMGPCSEDPHLGGASWLLGLTSLLLSVGSTGTQSSGNAVSLKGMQGASVSFHVIRNPDLPPVDELEKISWGIVFRSNYIVMLQVFPGAEVPEWINWQDKFQKRVHVFNITTLRIDNLTLEDTGLYRARDSYRRGRQYDQDFHLTVYDPQGQADASQLPSILGTVVVLLLILGAGLFLWRTRVKKSLEPGRGAGSQEEHRDPDGGIHYAELSQQGTGDSRDQGRGAARLEGDKPLTTVYSEVRRAGVALMRI